MNGTVTVNNSTTAAPASGAVNSPGILPNLPNPPVYPTLGSNERMFKFIQVDLKSLPGHLLIAWDIEDRYVVNTNLAFSLIIEYMMDGDCLVTANPDKQTIPLGSQVRSYEIQDARHWSILAATIEGKDSTANKEDHLTEVVATHEESPSMAVKNLRATSVQAEAAQIAWDPPPCAGRGGVLKHYDVEVTSTGDYSGQQMFSTQTTDASISALRPYSDYEVRVRYVNWQGEGPWCPPLAIKTTQGAPEAPVMLYNFTNDDISIGLFIGPPPNSNGLLDQYQVELRGHPTGISLMYTPYNGTDYIVGNVKPGTKYTIKVRAHNSAGWGPWSRKVTVVTNRAVRPVPSALRQTEATKTCIRFKWASPGQLEDMVSRYQIYITANNDVKTNFSSTAPREARHYEQCGLSAYTQYTVGVAVMRDTGHIGQAIARHMWTEGLTPPEPRSPVVLETTDTTITLELFPVIFDFGPLTSYEIRVLRVYHNHSVNRPHKYKENDNERRVPLSFLAPNGKLGKYGDNALHRGSEPNIKPLSKQRHGRSAAAQDKSPEHELPRAKPATGNPKEPLLESEPFLLALGVALPHRAMDRSHASDRSHAYWRWKELWLASGLDDPRVQVRPRRSPKKLKATHAKDEGLKRKKRSFRSPPGVLWLELLPRDITERAMIIIGSGKWFRGQPNMPLAPDSEYAIVYVVKSTVVDITKHSYTFATTTAFTKAGSGLWSWNEKLFLYIMVPISVLLFFLMGFFVIRHVIKHLGGKLPQKDGDGGSESGSSSSDHDDDDDQNSLFNDSDQLTSSGEDDADNDASKKAKSQDPTKNVKGLESFFNRTHVVGEPRYITTMRENVLYPPNSHGDDENDNTNINNCKVDRNSNAVSKKDKAHRTRKLKKTTSTEASTLNPSFRYSSSSLESSSCGGDIGNTCNDERDTTKRIKENIELDGTLGVHSHSTPSKMTGAPPVEHLVDGSKNRRVETHTNLIDSHDCVSTIGSSSCSYACNGFSSECSSSSNCSCSKSVERSHTSSCSQKYFHRFEGCDGNTGSHEKAQQSRTSMTIEDLEADMNQVDMERDVSGIISYLYECDTQQKKESERGMSETSSDVTLSSSCSEYEEHEITLKSISDQKISPTLCPSQNAHSSMKSANNTFSKIDLGKAGDVSKVSVSSKNCLETPRRKETHSDSNSFKPLSSNLNKTTESSSSDASGTLRLSSSTDDNVYDRSLSSHGNRIQEDSSLQQKKYSKLAPVQASSPSRKACLDIKRDGDESSKCDLGQSKLNSKDTSDTNNNGLHGDSVWGDEHRAENFLVDTMEVEEVIGDAGEEEIGGGSNKEERERASSYIDDCDNGEDGDTTESEEDDNGDEDESNENCIEDTDEDSYGDDGGGCGGDGDSGSGCLSDFDNVERDGGVSDGNSCGGKGGDGGSGGDGGKGGGGGGGGKGGGGKGGGGKGGGGSGGGKGGGGGSGGGKGGGGGGGKGGDSGKGGGGKGGDSGSGGGGKGGDGSDGGGGGGGGGKGGSGGGGGKGGSGGGGGKGSKGGGGGGDGKGGSGVGGGSCSGGGGSSGGGSGKGGDGGGKGGSSVGGGSGGGSRFRSDPDGSGGWGDGTNSLDRGGGSINFESLIGICNNSSRAGSQACEISSTETVDNVTEHGLPYQLTCVRRKKFNNADGNVNTNENGTSTSESDSEENENERIYDELERTRDVEETKEEMADDESDKSEDEDAKDNDVNTTPKRNQKKVNFASGAKESSEHKVVVNASKAKKNKRVLKKLPNAKKGKVSKIIKVDKDCEKSSTSEISQSIFEEPTRVEKEETPRSKSFRLSRFFSLRGSQPNRSQTQNTKDSTTSDAEPPEATSDQKDTSVTTAETKPLETKARRGIFMFRTKRNIAGARDKQIPSDIAASPDTMNESHDATLVQNISQNRNESHDKGLKTSKSVSEKSLVKSGKDKKMKEKNRKRNKSGNSNVPSKRNKKKNRQSKSLELVSSSEQEVSDNQGPKKFGFFKNRMRRFGKSNTNKASIEKNGYLNTKPGPCAIVDDFVSEQDEIDTSEDHSSKDAAPKSKVWRSRLSSLWRKNKMTRGSLDIKQTVEQNLQRHRRGPLTYDAAGMSEALMPHGLPRNYQPRRREFIHQRTHHRGRQKKEIENNLNYNKDPLSQEHSGQQSRTDQRSFYFKQGKRGKKLSFIDEFNMLEAFRKKALKKMHFQAAKEHWCKNRYLHIQPPDHSRVNVEKVSADETDYYNAVYIQTERTYIAAQTPFSPDLVNDFWSMVIQNNVETIVLLCNCVEGGMVKCVPYWAQSGVFVGGSVLVETLEVHSYADFVIRLLKVSTAGSEDLMVTHFQFLTWPANSILSDPFPLLELRYHVRRLSGDKTTPLLVQCVTGVGRSAVFIAVDNLIEDYGRDGYVSVYNFVKRMRQSHPYSVRTFRHYRLIYETLFEEFQAGNTIILCSSFRERYHELCRKNPSSGTSYLVDQFVMLNQFTPDLSDKICSDANKPENRPKNTSQDIVPPDWHRPVLNIAEWSCPPLGYINAVFIDGLIRRTEFIVTQAPLTNTVFDFWRMIFDYQVQTIVMLGPCKGKNLVPYYPKTGARQFQYLHVEHVNSAEVGIVTVRNFKMCTLTVRGLERMAVRHFHVKYWADEDSSLEFYRLESQPDSKADLLTLIDMVMDWQMLANRRTRPIAVVDKDGASISGVFCACALLCERMRVNREVDIYHSVKHMKRRRPQFISSFEQYRYLHHLLWEYLTEYMTGCREEATANQPDESQPTMSPCSSVSEPKPTEPCGLIWPCSEDNSINDYHLPEDDSPVRNTDDSCVQEVSIVYTNADDGCGCVKDSARPRSRKVGEPCREDPCREDPCREDPCREHPCREDPCSQFIPQSRSTGDPCRAFGINRKEVKDFCKEISDVNSYPRNDETDCRAKFFEMRSPYKDTDETALKSTIEKFRKMPRVKMEKDISRRASLLSSDGITDTPKKTLLKDGAKQFLRKKSVGKGGMSRRISVEEMANEMSKKPSLPISENETMSKWFIANGAQGQVGRPSHINAQKETSVMSRKPPTSNDPKDAAWKSVHENDYTAALKTLQTNVEITGVSTVASPLLKDTEQVSKKPSFLSDSTEASLRQYLANSPLGRTAQKQSHTPGGGKSKGSSLPQNIGKDRSPAFSTDVDRTKTSYLKRHTAASTSSRNPFQGDKLTGMSRETSLKEMEAKAFENITSLEIPKEISKVPTGAQPHVAGKETSSVRFTKPEKLYYDKYDAKTTTNSKLGVAPTLPLTQVTDHPSKPRMFNKSYEAPSDGLDQVREQDDSGSDRKTTGKLLDQQLNFRYNTVEPVQGTSRNYLKSNQGGLDKSTLEMLYGNKTKEAKFGHTSTFGPFNTDGISSKVGGKTTRDSDETNKARLSYGSEYGVSNYDSISSKGHDKTAPVATGTSKAKAGLITAFDKPNKGNISVKSNGEKLTLQIPSHSRGQAKGNSSAQVTDEEVKNKSNVLDDVSHNKCWESTPCEEFQRSLTGQSRTSRSDSMDSLVEDSEPKQARRFKAVVRMSPTAVCDTGKTDDESQPVCFELVENDTVCVDRDTPLGHVSTCTTAGKGGAMTTRVRFSSSPPKEPDHSVSNEKNKDQQSICPNFVKQFEEARNHMWAKNMTSSRAGSQKEDSTESMRTSLDVSSEYDLIVDAKPALGE